MHFIPNEIYHVYNRGNNKQLIFFNNKNYLFFLTKIRNEWKKYCDIICYCLMPNHFHFMLIPNKDGCKNITLDNKETSLQNLSKAIGISLSSYTKAINNQNQTNGNLFQKKTQAKCLTNVCSQFTSHEYLITCFHYIHQNPCAAGIVNHLKDWEYASYRDFYGYRNGTLCNKKLAMDALSFTENDFRKEEHVSLKEEIISEIF